MNALVASHRSIGSAGSAVCWWQAEAHHRQWWPVHGICGAAGGLHHEMPWLESPWVGGVLCACTVLAVAAWVWRADRRWYGGTLWRRRAGRGVAAAGVAVLGCLTVLAFVNSYAGYAPSPSSLAPLLFGGRSTVVTASVESSEIRMVDVGAHQLDISPRPAYVYLPPGYGAPVNAHRYYPVVYLIHGYPGGAADWVEAADLRHTLDALIATRRIPPLIAVTPDANGGWTHDSECLNQVGGPQVASYLTQTVVSYTDAHFRALTGRADRVLGGASSGGYCALNLGLHHQDEYSALLAFEPYGTPGVASRQALLGGSEPLYWDNSPSSYIPSMRFADHMAVFADAGGASPDIGTAWGLASQLAARGQTVAFRVEPGQSHTWREAALGLPYALVFTAGQLPPAPGQVTEAAARAHHGWNRDPDHDGDLR
jgi:enterochelin esterase-like enzyme